MDESGKSPGDKAETVERLQSMPTLDALAVELGIESRTVEGEIVTDAVEPSRSMADFIPVETLLTFTITVLWSMVQKVVAGAEKVEMSKGEIQVLVNGWTPVVEELMPDIPDGKWEAALMCTAAVGMPKLMQVQKAKKDKLKKEPGSGNDSKPGQKQKKQEPVEVVPDFIDKRELRKNGKG